MTEISRRDFLKLTRNGFLYLSGLLTLGGLLRFLDFQTDPAPKTRFELGPAENYPLNSHTMLEEIPAILQHTEQGFSALSLVCTHLGCSVEKEAQGFACPCHGSRFDADGNVMHGPAVKGLSSLRVEMTEDNQLILYTE
jgi:cytochrome b6-f complex iron-sulfur subunit